ncbi:hypothetical protein Tco_1077747 [Tanacetum coccineum]
MKVMLLFKTRFHLNLETPDVPLFLALLAKPSQGSSNSHTDKIMARMDDMTMKMDAQYKEMQSRSNHSIHEYDEDDKPMSPEEEAKFMQTF